jgi:ATP-dependent DNA ligase
VKWRANREQEFVIGGYTLNGNARDSILVGYYKGRDFMYAGRVRAGIPSEFRLAPPPYFEKLRVPRCPSLIYRTVLKGAGARVSRPREWRHAVGRILSSLPESSFWIGRLRIGWVTGGSPE